MAAVSVKTYPELADFCKDTFYTFASSSLCCSCRSVRMYTVIH